MGKINLQDLYNPELLQIVLNDKSKIGRRLTALPEKQIFPTQLIQPIDINVRCEGNKTVNLRNMDGYPLRSVENALDTLPAILKTGINTVALRLIASSAETGPAGLGRGEDPYHLLAEQAVAIERIRKAYPPKDLTIMADPFGLALNKDKTWGIQTRGSIDYFKTLEFIANIAKTYSDSRVDWLLSLGRIEREVDVVKRVLNKENSAMRVASFSTNLETKNAYVYVEGEPASTDTGQKIVVGSTTEMLLRGVFDSYEGTEAIIVKPSENFHILSGLVHLLSDPNILVDFLTSPQVAGLLAGNDYLQTLKQNILAEPQAFLAKSRKIGLGGYTVSGTYYQDHQIQQRKGETFLWEVLNERFHNIRGALRDWDGQIRIIDRNACFYARNLIWQPGLPLAGFKVLERK
jgi:delta-aminolevulinic acid dehydratase/porphobilinogen synthase